MNTLRTAAQQVLEALEQIAVLAEYGTTGPGKCHSRALNERQATSLRLSVSDLSRAQITVLRAALAEPPVQEPVAWRTKNATPPGGYVVFQQYPSAVADLGGEIEPLYAAPPQRKPLSGLEVERLLEQSIGSLPAARRLVRAIERAHGIGENT